MKDLDFEYVYKVLTVLGKSTEDYLFIYDMEKNEYAISENATRRFAIDCAHVKDANALLEKVCHKEDLSALLENVEGLKNKTVQEHNMEYRWMDKQGNPVKISCRGQVVCDDDDRAKYLIGRVTEIGRRNVFDNVTGLYREMNLASDLEKLQKENPAGGYLMLLGIDNFREINDKYGKAFGDEMLALFAESVRSSVSGNVQCYRMSGDEIGILAMGAKKETKKDPARDLYHSVRLNVDRMISKTDYQHFFTISGGSAYFLTQTTDAVLLAKKAEFALHQAKAIGKNTYTTYSQEKYDEFARKLDMQERLRESVRNGFRGFELYYQPIVNIKEKKVLGAEALLRWEDEMFGRVSPIDFIPLLEESGLIIPVGRWIIEQAMEQCLKWQRENEEFRININLSFIQIKKSNIIQDIDDCMQELHFNSRNVLFEVTESGELEEGYMTKRILQSFQRRKLDLGIDDFGTGYSNLRYIKEMMFDLVKIDREFIKNITKSQYDYLVVKQFTELAHSLNLRVCYEGVETKEDLDCVLELEPDYIQGFYFSKPVTAAEFERDFLCRQVM